MSRIIFHCDCNGFYASVAEIMNPELKKVPMAVCGDPHSRQGIILAKNELAKKFGIQTAETIWKAKQKCPSLVLAPTYWEQYNKYFTEINEIYEEYTDVIERFGIDESYLDLTNSIHLFGNDPLKLANAIRERIKKEIGLTISIGVSFNKIFAKLGSDYKKPDAVTIVNQDNFKNLLWSLPVDRMLMVGKSTQVIMEKLYIKTIGELAKTEKSILISRLGKLGETLYDSANGLDQSLVVPYIMAEKAHSIGNGRTFKRNLVTERDILVGASALSDTVATRLRKSGVKCVSLQVTIKDGNLKSITRQKILDQPTYLAKEIANVSMEIIRDSWKIGVPIRMLTITAQKLVPSQDAVEQISFFDPQNKKKQEQKQEDLETAVDTLRSKFGKSSITYGSIIDNDLGLK